MHIESARGIRSAARLISMRTLHTTPIQQASSSLPPSKAKRSRFLRGQQQHQQQLTLEHFLLRSKSIKLYRDFLRASRNIPNPGARRETVDWLRDEHFEGPSGLKAEFDTTRVRELLVAGNVALKRICGPMELVAALNPKHGAFPKLRGSRTG